MNKAATEIKYSGVHHLALVSRDMEKTVDFYTNVLNMKYIKGFDLGGNSSGQHFFFDMGGGNLLAFFWFKGAPKAAPGIASAHGLAGESGDITSAHGSMNHVAFHCAVDDIEAYRDTLVAKGVHCTEIVNHSDVVTEPGIDRHSKTPDDKTWIRSFYFFDPDGIMLEFCCNVRAGSDYCELPVNAEGIKANGKSI
ncbi:MAG: VOC family protein [Pseudomonadales bacterium]